MAADAEESEVHAVCMAVPVSDETGRVVGAVSVTGPKNRMLGIGIEKVVQELLQTGDEITAAMGGRCAEARPSAQNLAAQMLRLFRQSQ
jgi:DNA-binding IclR family transcriptional regulator